MIVRHIWRRFAKGQLIQQSYIIMIIVNRRKEREKEIERERERER